MMHLSDNDKVQSLIRQRLVLNTIIADTQKVVGTSRHLNLNARYYAPSAGRQRDNIEMAPTPLPDETCQRIIATTLEALVRAAVTEIAVIDQALLTLGVQPDL